MWYKALLEVLQHQLELLSPRLQKADVQQEEDTCALLAAACSHAKAFSELMQVTKSHQRKQVPASAERLLCLCHWIDARPDSSGLLDLRWNARPPAWRCSHHVARSVGHIDTQTAACVPCRGGISCCAGLDAGSEERSADY